MGYLDLRADSTELFALLRRFPGLRKRLLLWHVIPNLSKNRIKIGHLVRAKGFAP